jgi:Resolvase, N terminal domain
MLILAANRSLAHSLYSPSRQGGLSMKAAIEGRVSTFDQEPENQLAELRRYAAARGWAATAYVDKGVSGTKDKRPTLDHGRGVVAGGPRPAAAAGLHAAYAPGRRVHTSWRGHVHLTASGFCAHVRHMVLDSATADRPCPSGGRI